MTSLRRSRGPILRLLAAVLAAAAATTGPAQTPPAGIEGQEELVVVARWPDGLPARGIGLALYGIRATAPAEPIDVARTDADGRATFDVDGGSGPAEIRAGDATISWNVPIVLPHPEPIGIVLPEPLEIAVLLRSSDPEAFEQTTFWGRPEEESERRLPQATPDRFVWRSLKPAPITLQYGSTWGWFAVRPRSGLDHTGKHEAVLTPPATVEFDAVRKRRLTARVVTSEGQPVSLAEVRWRFSPAKDYGAQGSTRSGSDGLLTLVEPESWTLNGAPDGGSVLVHVDDPRITTRIEVERPWPSAGDVDLGDLVVAVRPDRILRAVNDAGRPVPAAEFLDLEESVIGRTDETGTIVISATGAPGRILRASGHVREPVPADLFAGDQDRAIVLSREARVEVVLDPGSGEDMEPCLHTAPGVEGNLAAVPCPSGGG